MPWLSILICTLPQRWELFKGLFEEINRQVASLPFPEGVQWVEVLWDNDTTITTGKKRQRLLELARGNFVVWIDDDDKVIDRYVKLIVDTISNNPDVDCIGMNGWITTNGADRRHWEISRTFGGWYELNGVYYRTPNHISPVKREIALKVGFPDKTFGEDADYSKGILPYLKTEAWIKEEIYHYDFRTNK